MARLRKSRARADLAVGIVSVGWSALSVAENQTASFVLSLVDKSAASENKAHPIFRMDLSESEARAVVADLAGYLTRPPTALDAWKPRKASEALRQLAEQFELVGN